MTKFTRFKMLLMALVMLVGSGNVWGAEETYTYTTGDGTWVTENTVRIYQSANFTFLHKKNSSSTNIATTYAELRIYASHSMEIYPTVAGKTISSIEVTASSSSYATAMGNATVLAGTTSSTASSVTGVSSVVGSVATFNLSGVSGCEYVKFTLAAQSRVLSFKITYTEASTSTVATPGFTVAGVVKTTNTYFNTAQVTLSTTTDGASIYYTDNGDVPTTSSTLYSAPFNVTSTKTIKAIAVKAGMDNSTVAERTITIVAPATASVPYTEAFNNTLGDWYNYEVSGTKPWAASANGAYVNGYGGGTVESWLVSPEFTVTESGVNLSFNYASKYVGNSLLVKVSTDYQGYGSPAVATWTTLATIEAPTVQDDAYTVKYSGNLLYGTAGNVHFALVYATSANYSDWRITNVNVAVPTATPSILVTESTVPAMTAFTGGTDTETITVNGSNLTANIGLAVTGTDASLFTLSTNSIAPTDGTVSNVVVTITYTPVSAGSHSATLTLSSTDAESVVKSLSGTATVPPTAPDVIITEVYGGGGNSGATYTNDFFELYNTTENSVQIGGWSIQYFSAATTGLASNIITIPVGKYIPAKSHFLIQGASGGAVGSALTTPDVTGTVNASGTAGKIILYTTDAAQTISDIASITGNAYFKDYVPYGTTAVPVWGSAMSSNASNTTSASRKVVSGEYLYSQIIGSDFEVATPSPESTGLTTSVNNPVNSSNITAFDGKIRFSATAGQQVEVYNAVGQKLMSATTLDGLNTLNVNAKGMMIVKVGDRLAKVIL